MEFNEKLQELRKQMGLTQEELAQALFVSRTAISKWESGRGYPNIDSLKTTAKFFGVTIDELLSGDELLTIAQEDTKQKEKRFLDTIFGLFDCSIAMFFFLPFFGQTIEGVVESVSLLSLTDAPEYLKVAFFASVISMVAFGILTLALQNSNNNFWTKSKNSISLALNSVGVLLFIMSSQPYAAAFIFIFMVIKGIMLIKRQ